MDITASSWRVMAVVAHQDDFEINAGGTFALLRQVYGSEVQLRVLTTSRGASGHHEMDADATAARRDAEARASASMIDAQYDCLTQLDGTHVPAQVLVDRNLLGGLWNAIRAFEPHVIFCPPITRDPLAGIHVDHENTAHAVRMVAYQLVVPRAYPTLQGPVKQRVVQPLILNMDDGYACEGHFDIRQDITEVWDLKVAMAQCHVSQMREWLPFTRGEPAPDDAQWQRNFIQRHLNANKRYGQPDQRRCEYFRVTHWSRAPQADELDRLFPRRVSVKPVNGCD